MIVLFNFVLKSWIFKICAAKRKSQKTTYVPAFHQNRTIWQNQAVFLICIRHHFFLNGVDALINFNVNFSKNWYFRNNRVPGQFGMCENLPRHRFQFNSQISIYFDIKQWFPIDIRKKNIILSISMQTVKKSPEKTLKETL